MTTLKSHGNIGTWKRKRKEFVEEVELTFNTSTPISIEGYKIKQIIVDNAWYNSYSTRWVSGIIDISSVDRSKPNLYSRIYSGGTRGYDYGQSLGRYGGICKSNPASANEQHCLVQVGEGVTTVNNGAIRYILTPENVQYWIGTTYGTWLQTGTYTFDDTMKSALEALFEDQNISAYLGTERDDTDFTWYYKKLTITYK